MGTLLFRKAATGDKQKVLTLLSERQDEANSLHGGTENTVLEDGSTLFDEILGNHMMIVIVGEMDDQIVATLTIYLLPRIRSGGYVAVFEDILVAKEMRGKHVGKEMMEHAIDICKQDKRIKKIKLGSRKDESGIHSFYTKLGFEHKEHLFHFSLKE